MVCFLLSLFNSCIDFVLGEVADQNRYGTYVYADDVVLLVESPEVLHEKAKPV